MRNLKLFVLIAALIAFFALPNTTVTGEQVSEFEATFVAETRCGWFHNPTPANAWLIDRDGEWTIGVQGGYQAEGDWPSFKDSQWVKTNVNYGYGCACMNVSVNKDENKIVEIRSATARPLAACRKDKAIKRKEPKE